MDKAREDRMTMEAIGRIYCRGNHKNRQCDQSGMCPECRLAIEETLERTATCPKGHVGNCEDCDIHCQRGEAQENIKRIMRYAAPRMMFRHPLMAARYLRKKLTHRATLGRN